jgi:hypothetical protein
MLFELVILPLLILALAGVGFVLTKDWGAA